MSQDTEQLQKDMAELTSRFKTVLIATCNADGEPEISYTPRIIVDGFLYVFVSELSLHTGNLQQNPRASLLFIENESDCENLHARRRVTYRAGASLIPRDDPEWTAILQEFEHRFGDIMSLLKSLAELPFVSL